LHKIERFVAYKEIFLSKTSRYPTPKGSWEKDVAPIYLIAGLPCALLGLAGIAAFFADARRAPTLLGVTEGGAGAAMLAAFASGLVLLAMGPGRSVLLGWRGAGVCVRLDAVSEVMLLLVAFIGWIVVRYARTYLYGEARQGAFLGWLCFTLSSVLLFLSAENLTQLALGWIGASLCLHRLLLFYPNRPTARRAARKKFITARLSDVALVVALGVLAARFGSLDLTVILQGARSSPGDGAMYLAAGLLAAAGCLKSAQFPTQGWLTEMMEAPTPVSALLHAGVVNAGGFLLIRFADVMVLAPGVLASLATLGGFTAICGALVMLTQPAVKTSLAWSTVAQMGFMMLECGLALFPLALLHIVAHSLYKAHAFLSSGGAVETIAANRRPGPVATPKASAVGRAFVAALGIYLLIGLLFGFQHKSPQAVALGAILIFGVAYLLAQGFADQAPKALTRRTAFYALAASVSYFALQIAASWATAGTLPAAPQPGALEWCLIILALASFGATAVVQAMFPLWAYHPAAAGLRVHLSNGFYANALFDRITGAWSLDHVG